MPQIGRVSVIVPAYNAEAFVEEAIESALGQTYRDVEIIVVNDGSTDRTAERLATFGNRIRVHAQTNGGVSRARNVGARLSTGEWLAFLDADDVWSPEKLERQLALAEAGTALLYTDRFNIGDCGDLPHVHSQVVPMYEGDLFLPLLLEGNFVTASSAMVRRVVFDSHGGFDEPLTTCEDWDLWLRIAADHPVRLCPEPVVGYRFHGGGASRNYLRMWRDRDRVVRRALASPRGQTVGWRTRRRVWAFTWVTNAGEAVAAGNRAAALTAFARAAVQWPGDSTPYRGIAKLCLGDSRLSATASTINQAIKSALRRSTPSS